jgi:hypothetical protein
MMDLPLLLSTAFLPPIEYFQNLVSASNIVIEKHEHFIKQTYRNRCTILGANGPIDLVIPVEKGRNGKTPIKELRISYDTGWQRNHWRTIFSAYNSSPFFEYYEDDFLPFFDKRWDFLFDYNIELLKVVLEILDIPATISFSGHFEKIPEGKTDFREAISPKINPAGIFQPYTQVFSEKFGFVPNLSIIDLIFNMGTESTEILKSGEKLNRK